MQKRDLKLSLQPAGLVCTQVHLCHVSTVLIEHLLGATEQMNTLIQDAREGLAKLHGEPVKADINDEKVKIEGAAATKPAQRTVLDSLVGLLNYAINTHWVVFCNIH